MGRIVKFFRVTMLWIVLLPYALVFLGAASNQAVIIANHDKFPVLINSRALAQADADEDGMLDNEHCIMTKDTHLNFLADIFDMKDSYISVGDMLLSVGEWIGTFSIFVWGSLVIIRLRDDD